MYFACADCADVHERYDVMQVLKSNPRITYRTATDEDIVSYYGHKSPYTIRALAFFYDGVLSGLAGYKWDGGHFVIFSEIKPELKVSKTSVFRCAKILLQFCGEKKSPMIAVATNPELCKKLGFTHLNGEIYEWRS